ncbi:MAG: efflux RND transporter periplasmic adaptor subunit [Bacteroidales bacterium]|nr:efflux RND transporter periplasmic adaptor subunit [Bacteroidales bacterium]
MKHVIILLCVAAMLMGCGGRKQDTGWRDAVGVRVAVVDEGENMHQREYVGSIGSEVEMDLFFPLGGKLTKVAVHNGQRVKKGQVLAEVDATTARSLWGSACAALRQAEDAYGRMQHVHKEGGISDVRWVQMETDLEKARQAETAARQRVDDCVLRAPFDGVVSCGTHHVGEELKPVEPFARVIDMGRLRVAFSVPEHEVGLLPVGTAAKAVVPALDDREFALRVSDKSLVANPLGHTYKVYGTMVQQSSSSNNSAGLLPDMVAKVKVDIDTKAGIVVPAECVQVMPEGTIVWVVEGGKACHRVVTVGDFIRNGVMVEAGLNAGDSVIVSGQQKLYSGAKVKIEN